MHTWSGNNDVPQSGYPELSDVFLALGEPVQARVRFRIRKAAGQIVQTSVPEWSFWRWPALVGDGATEIPSSMTLEARRSLAGEEEYLSPLRGVIDGVELAVEAIAIVGGTK